MDLLEKHLSIPKRYDLPDLIGNVRKEVLNSLNESEIPVRFVVTSSSDSQMHCEVGFLTGFENSGIIARDFIFGFKKRRSENTEKFNVVLIIPTGINAAIGGHSGDAGGVARLVAGACDTLITHPNVVNAADINEIPENSLYVEGSLLTRFLMGMIGLQKVRANRILVVLDQHQDSFFVDAAVNAVSAARASMGLDCPKVLILEPKTKLQAFYADSGRAVGSVTDFGILIEELKKRRAEYDAIALSSVIQVAEQYHYDYFVKDDIVNPWGGVEAMLTHSVSSILNVPSAHSPMEISRDIMNLEVGIVNPVKSAEAISTAYLHCILKGLHKSPKIIDLGLDHHIPNALTAEDISCLIIPTGCLGLPTLAALSQEIPVIAVQENTNLMNNRLEDLPFSKNKLHFVDNYLEAVGLLIALKAGVEPSSVRRPLDYTNLEYPASSEIITKPGDSISEIA